MYKINKLQLKLKIKIKKNNYFYKKGFTIIELFVVVFIIAIIGVITFSVFSDLQTKQDFDSDIAKVKSYIEKAKINSINVKDNKEYGVKFENNKIVYFEINNNQIIDIEDININLNIKENNLKKDNNSTTTLYFSKIEGYPNATGTIIYEKNVRDNIYEKEIKIEETGNIE